MKKLPILLILLLSVVLSSAQINASGLQSGNLATEVQFNMSNGWFGNVVVPTIRFRYGLSEQWYLRADLDGDINKSSASFFENPDGTGEEGTVSSYNSTFSFGIGAERHISSFKKLSPYVGAQFGVTMANWEQERIDVQNNRYEPGYKYIYQRPSVGADLYLFTGFDFWIYEKLYLGTEFGINFGQTWEGETITSTTINGTTTDSNRGPSSSFNIRKEVSPAIRIGYVLK